MKLIERRDLRLGLCIDVGHTARAKVDVAESIRKCRDRLYDVHFKDLNTTFPTGRDVEGGRGVLDLRGILQALLEIKFAHHVGIEYEKDADDPVPGIAETAGYAKGLLAGLA
jgi:sugar phosphate isomerase/epimerase